MDRLKTNNDSISKIFIEKGCDFSFLLEKNIPLTIFAEMIGVYHFFLSKGAALNHLLTSYSNRLDNDLQKNKLKILAELIVDYYLNAENIQDHDTIAALATIYVESYVNDHIIKGFAYEHLIFNDYSDSLIVDLASGPDFINFIPFIPRTNQYITIDPSLFVFYCIQYQAKKFKLNNYKSEIATTADYLINSKYESFDCVRAKNIFCYDKTFVYLAESYFDKITNLGKLVFQETASTDTFKILFQENEIIQMSENLIKKGANVTFIKGNENNILSFDTFSFEKNNGNDVTNEIEKLYEIILANQ